MTVIAKVKYQHDAQSPVIESDVVHRKVAYLDRLKDEYAIEATNKVLKTDDKKLRNIHSALMWEVDSQHGGWCETYTEDGATLMYRHDAERKEMEVKPEKKGKK